MRGLASATSRPALMRRGHGRHHHRAFFRSEPQHGSGLVRLQSVRYRSNWSADTAAHLTDSIQMLRAALQAKVVRPNV